MIKTTRIKIKKYSLLILLLFAIASLRIFMLDRDIPSWDISTLQPMDEYFYGTLAFNMYDYGKINIGDKIVVDAAKSIPQTKGTIIHNYIIYLSLSLFGNNYYGLRLPSVLCSFLSIILLLVILTRIRKDDSEEEPSNEAKGKQLILFSLAYMVFDFTFLLTSRICEPVIFRMTFIMITLYMLYVFKNNISVKLKFFLFGLLSTLSFLLVYTVNFFAFAAAIMSMLVYLILYRDKKSAISTLFFIFGIIAAVIIANFYYEATWHGSLYSTIKSIFGIYGARANGVATIGLKEKLLTYYGRRDMFLNTNIFLYSPVLLLSLLVTLPISIYKAIKNRRITDIFIVSLVIMMYFQTIFLDDYTKRKVTTILPFVILCVFNGLMYKNNFISAARKKIKYADVFYGVYIIICSIVTFREPIKTFKNIRIFPNSLNNVLLGLNIVIVILFMLIYVMSIFVKIKRRSLLNVIFVIALLPSIILSIKYVYSYSNYSEKNIMVDVGKVVGDNYVIGGFPHSYRLYNSIKPALSDYDRFRGEKEYENFLIHYIKEEKVKYLLGYTEDEEKLKDMYLKNISGYKLQEIKRYERSFEENHKKTYISLYKIVEE